MRALWMFHRRLVVRVVIVGCLGVSPGCAVVWPGTAMLRGLSQPDRLAPSSAKRTANARPRRTLGRHPDPAAPTDRHPKGVDDRVGAGRDTGVDRRGERSPCPCSRGVDLRTRRSPPSIGAIRPPSPLPLPASSWTRTTPPSPASELLALGRATRRLPTPCRVSRPRWPARRWCSPWLIPTCPAARHHRRRRRHSGRSDGQGGEVQSVNGLQAEVDPDWTQIISEGWQPRDPRMTIEVGHRHDDVSPRRDRWHAAAIRFPSPSPWGRRPTCRARLRRRGGRGLDARANGLLVHRSGWLPGRSGRQVRPSRSPTRPSAPSPRTSGTRPTPRSTGSGARSAGPRPSRSPARP